jgi:hypothetical protein
MEADMKQHTRDQQFWFRGDEQAPQGLPLSSAAACAAAVFDGVLRDDYHRE